MDKKQAYEILKDSEVFGAVELYQEKEVKAFKIALEVLKEKRKFVKKLFLPFVTL